MKVLISAGPTREKIDPARFISNFSSGKMGYALAAASAKSGLKTVLVSGPVSIKPPRNVKIINVESSAEMTCEIRREAKNSDIIIMAAAVADYRPLKYANEKIKKSHSEKITIELEKTEDILASLGKNKKKGQILCGFSAETSKLVPNALKKLKSKNLDWIIANEIGRPGRGFGCDTNEVIMISKDGEKVKFPLQKKRPLAEKILKLILRSCNT